ncbi:MAG: methyl-accepting chemotaxis protein [Lachnospiraceae bacterium]|nr:methyl-accepting chemotaxis protein [Lachnospiraceae bacterium]
MDLKKLSSRKKDDTGSAAKGREKSNVKDKNVRGKVKFGIRFKILVIMLVPMFIIVLAASLALGSVGKNVSKKMAEQELMIAQSMFSQNIESMTYGGYQIEDGKLFKGTLDVKYKEKDLEELFVEAGVSLAFFTEDGIVVSSSEIQDAKMTESIKKKIFAAEPQPVFDNSYNINGTEYFTYFAPLADEDGVIVASLMSAVPTKEIKEEYEGVILTNVISITLLIVLFCIVMAFVLSALVKGIVSIVSNLDRMESGELNIKVSNKLIGRKDEVGRIAKAVHSVVHSFSETIVGIHTSMKQLDEFSETFADNFNTISESIENINIAVNEIAEGSTQQAADTQSVGEGISDMGNAIDRTTESIDGLSRSAAIMKESNETVESTLKELIEISERTEGSVDEVQKQTDLTNASAQEINTAVELIAGLAGKTNLLSLNASIEAARAGEMGRGFAVVAEEIRDLADQSKESADTIRKIVQTLIDNSNQSVHIMDEVVGEIKLQGEKLEATGEVFERLNAEVHKVVRAIADISEEINNITQIKENVIANVDGLASVSENNAAGTEETVATMEQLDRIVNDCRETTKELKRISDELIGNANKFRL